MPDLLTVLALAAFVLVFAGLSEGFVARAPLSFPILFLGLGYWLGSRRVIPNDLHHSPILEAVAVVTLALVLFLDAMRMKFDRAPSEWLVPSLVLGPGTLLCVALVATAAHFLLGTGLLLSILLGAILSSTDPVVLRDIVRDKRVPSAIRQALTTEAATNDVIVLPIVLVVIAVAKAEASTAGGWAIFIARLLVLGPAIGFAIGAFGAAPPKDGLQRRGAARRPRILAPAPRLRLHPFFSLSRRERGKGLTSRGFRRCRVTAVEDRWDTGSPFASGPVARKMNRRRSQGQRGDKLRTDSSHPGDPWNFCAVRFWSDAPFRACGSCAWPRSTRF